MVEVFVRSICITVTDCRALFPVLQIARKLDRTSHAFPQHKPVTYMRIAVGVGWRARDFVEVSCISHTAWNIQPARSNIEHPWHCMENGLILS